MNYPGTELELFAEATNWKRYFASKLRPFVRGRVLDVGCGMGVNANYLVGPTVSSYTFLEHIEQGPDELDRAYSLLAPGGHLLVLVPAYQFLYSKFDEEVGHVKRYNKEQMRSELPRWARPVSLYYLDSMGVLLSLANKFLLHQARPTRSPFPGSWTRCLSIRPDDP